MSHQAPAPTYRVRSIISAALGVAGGCTGPNSDYVLDVVPDMAATVGEEYKPALIHDIDLDPGNGPFGNGQRVVLERVVAISKVDKYVNAANQQCRYQIWVQDATCTTPPCGLVVKAIGPPAPSPTATGKDCPSARESGTLIGGFGRGDNMRVSGKLLFELDDVAPMGVVEHQLYVEAIEALPTQQFIAPLVLSDPALHGQFLTHLGRTWNKYEGMYLTLQRPTGVLQVSEFHSEGFRTTPGSTDWGNTFDSEYYPAGATTFPTVGSMYQSISGVVSTRHGGELMPVRSRDFVP